MPWPLAFPASTASTRPSCPFWPTRSSAPAASWCSDPIRAGRVILGVTLRRGWRSESRRRTAGMMAIVSGAVCILAGVARLGFVTELLSKPIRYGYMNECCAHGTREPTAEAVRLPIEKQGLAGQLVDRRESRLNGRTNATNSRSGRLHSQSSARSRHTKACQGSLWCVTGATTSVQLFDLSTRAGVSVLGPLASRAACILRAVGRPSRLAPILSEAWRGHGVLRRYQRAVSWVYAARTWPTLSIASQEMVGLGVGKPRGRLFPGLPDQ